MHKSTRHEPQTAPHPCWGNALPPWTWGLCGTDWDCALSTGAAQGHRDREFPRFTAEAVRVQRGDMFCPRSPRWKLVGLLFSPTSPESASNSNTFSLTSSLSLSSPNHLISDRALADTIIWC